MSTLAGIDLGTTYSALAVLNELGKPEIVPDGNANRIIPSVVAFSSENSAVIGSGAKNLLLVDPKNVIQFVKRQMGNPSFRYTVFGKEYSPVDISALILKKIKDECIQNGEIHDVVITVPAHFNEIQRKSTMDAGAIAGLNVLGIINEPTAAALYYGTLARTNGNIIVYDLGGGTFDISILNINGSDIKILTSKGDGHLGGVDFDHEIVKYVASEFQKQNGVDLFSSALLSNRAGMPPENEAVLYYKFMAEAEKAKKALSIRPKADIRLVSEKGNVHVPLSREKFEDLISSYVATTEMLVENALEDAKIGASDITKVILVGGSTRIPSVTKSIEGIFGFPPEKAVNVDEAVALGAAISAGMKKMAADGAAAVPVAIRHEISKTQLTEVCNKYFGMLAMTFVKEYQRHEAQNSIILRKNMPVPCEQTEDYYTILDGQDLLNVEVTECDEERYDSDVPRIGEIPLVLPPNTPENSLVKVTFKYDANQRLQCSIQLPGGAIYESEIGYDDKGNLKQSEVRRKADAINDFIVE
jgi:molecular chaperone DnaK